MARQSTRVTARKRAASDDDATTARSSRSAAVQQPRRSSTRGTRRKSLQKPSKSSEVSPKKSQYFDHNSHDPTERTDNDTEASAYEEDSDNVATSLEEEEDTEEDSSADERPAKRVRRGKKADSSLPVKSVAGSELWRPGVKVDLEPGQEVFIKLPKSREPGSTPYTDDAIHPNTFLFLGDLAKHNDRDWLKLHDADYRQSKKDFDSFVDCLTESVIEKDDTIPELPAKDLTFRIYRDVRFSSDQTPYKTHFSAAWSRTGRKGPYAAYYLQIKPGGSFVGGGLWCPDAEPLSKLRRDVARKSHKIKNVLLDAGIRRHFLGDIVKDEKKAVKAFIDHNGENMLKSRPKVGLQALVPGRSADLCQGYDKDDPNIGILRLRNYTIGSKLKDEQVVGVKGLRTIADMIGHLTPFVSC